VTRSWRRTLSIALALLLLALGGAAWTLHDPAAIAVAYKAKTFCSGTFVSHREPQALLAEMQADDLAPLRFVSVSMDVKGRSVTASAFGFLTRTAIYRSGLGCALVLDGRTPSALPPMVTASESRTLPGDTFSSAPTLEKLEEAIARAFEEPEPARPRRTAAVLVLAGHRVLAERYASGISRDTPLVGWSITQRVTSALIGILVREGRLALDRPVPVPEWQHANDARAAITLDQLLRMSSGLRFDEGMSTLTSDVTRMLFEAGDVAAFAAAKPLAAAPGTTWRYSSGTTNILARIIRNVLHDDGEYLSFPFSALFARIGMTTAVLETDASGTFVGSSFMYACARDWARFGRLYLQDGMWDGRRVLPEGWVAYSVSPAPADRSAHYGAHFWRNVPQEYCASGDRLSEDVFHTIGHEGQFITIVPSSDVVIVRLGRTRYPAAWDHCAFVSDVLAALSRR
jgi:CubicO group peptidase (beta-lactamase class C family)